MNISTQGVSFIKSNEGLSLIAYSDGKGISEGFSIGYGHYLTAAEIEKYKNASGGASISKETAEQLLADDIAERAIALNKALKVEVSQQLFDALIDYGFSMSGASLAKSKLVELINQKAPVEEVKKHWLQSYVKYGGDLNYKVLVERRKKEVAVAFSAVNAFALKIGMHYTTPLQALSFAIVLIIIFLIIIYLIIKK